MSLFPSLAVPLWIGLLLTGLGLQLLGRTVLLLPVRLVWILIGLGWLVVGLIVFWCQWTHAELSWRCAVGWHRWDRVPASVVGPALVICQRCARVHVIVEEEEHADDARTEHHAGR